jgi:hypothetical protein
MVEREEASRIHGKVCDLLGRDDIVFRYSTSEQAVKESSRGFSIQMERPEGRGGFKAIVDYKGAGNPIRLLMEFHWPPSEVHVAEQFDMTTQAVFEGLEGDWQRVMAEARIRSQCSVRGNNALNFMQENLVNLRSNQTEHLGSPVTFASLRVHVSPSVQTRDSLEHPRRELKVEILNEDPKALYLELMSQWSQVPVAGQTIDLTAIRPIDKKPSEYVRDAQQALITWVQAVATNEEGRNE